MSLLQAGLSRRTPASTPPHAGQASPPATSRRSTSPGSAFTVSTGASKHHQCGPPVSSWQTKGGRADPRTDVITVPSHTKKDNPKGCPLPHPHRQRRIPPPTSSFQVVRNRRPDQRISPGRMTWTRFSAPTVLAVAPERSVAGSSQPGDRRPARMAPGRRHLYVSSPPERATQIDLICVDLPFSAEQLPHTDRTTRRISHFASSAMVTFRHPAGFSGQPDVQCGMPAGCPGCCGVLVCAGVLMRVRAAPPGARSWR
jgi:hypothetical protein